MKCNGWTYLEMLKNTEDFLFDENNNKNSIHPYLQTRNDVNRPHLIVSSHWHLHPWGFDQMVDKKYNKRMRSVFEKATVGTFEVVKMFNYNQKKFYINAKLYKPRWRCSVVVPYVDFPMMVEEKREGKEDGSSGLDFSRLEQRLKPVNEVGFPLWTKRSIDFFFVGMMMDPSAESYKTRRLVAQAMPLINYKTENNFLFQKTDNKKVTYIVAERSSPARTKKCDYNQCHIQKTCSLCQLSPELSKNYQKYSLDSKFALIIHGDTGTTSRLYDAITNGQIPIIISTTIAYHGLPFRNKVPWLDMAFFIPVTFNDINKVDLAFLLEDVLNSPEWLLKRKFEKIVEYREDLSWSLPGSRVIENILVDAKSQCLQ